MELLQIWAFCLATGPGLPAMIDIQRHNDVAGYDDLVRDPTSQCYDYRVIPNGPSSRPAVATTEMVGKAIHVLTDDGSCMGFKAVKVAGYDDLAVTWEFVLGECTEKAV